MYDGIECRSIGDRRAVPREDSPGRRITDLPTKQRVILELVIQYYRLTGEPCSASYLARRLRVHHSTVQQHLLVLHKKGWLLTATGPAVPALTE
jgi:LexA DNA binding domain-containing protein